MLVMVRVCEYVRHVPPIPYPYRLPHCVFFSLRICRTSVPSTASSAASTMNYQTWRDNRLWKA